MTEPTLLLTVLDAPLAVCRLAPHAPLPEWASRGEFVSVTRTADELSLICPEASVPPDALHSGGWRALKVQGPLEFLLTGVFAALAAPLAAAGIPIFAIATYDTDYVLVQHDRLAEAIAVLTQAGHRFA
jgi:hypothetical protein